MTGRSTSVLVPCNCFGFRLSPIPQKGTEQLPTFRPMSAVAKRSPISATAGHLLGLAVQHGCRLSHPCSEAVFTAAGPHFP